MDQAPGARDADLQSRRRHFIEERFPELAAEGVTIDDPDAIVKAARLYYEEGSLPRAVELLQFAVEESPSHVQPWLALFEIYRLESFSHEYGQLATRFRMVHGEGDTWEKIQYNGRELNPDNPLYRA